MLSPDYILSILKTECAYRDGDSILIGVSGGADSVALLHLLHAAKIPVAAAHVNYGLRGEESDGDEKFVSELCAKLNVPLYIRHSSAEQLDATANNLQNAARIVRYRFFDEIITKESMRFIATAHHQDDQLETVLMNFLRGSTIRGMMGMSTLDEGSEIIVRPLLNCSRVEIETYLNTQALTWRNDSSNYTDQYLRNRMRTEVIPGIHAIDERSSKGWKFSIEQMRNSNTLLYALAATYIEHTMTKVGMIGKVNKQKVSAFAFPHILFNWILSQHGFSFQFSEEQFKTFAAQQTGKKYYSQNSELVVDRDYWIFRDVTAIKQNEFSIAPGEEKLDWSCSEASPAEPEKYTGYNALVDRSVIGEQLNVRRWKAGDKIQPFGFTGTRKVSDVLTEMKIPSDEKPNYPVLTSADEIVWIPGYRIADKYKITPETKTALHIKWNR